MFSSITSSHYSNPITYQSEANSQNKFPIQFGISSLPNKTDFGTKSETRRYLSTVMTTRKPSTIGIARRPLQTAGTSILLHFLPLTANPNSSFHLLTPTDVPPPASVLLLTQLPIVVRNAIEQPCIVVHFLLLI